MFNDMRLSSDMISLYKEYMDKSNDVSRSFFFVVVAASMGLISCLEITFGHDCQCINIHLLANEPRRFTQMHIPHTDWKSTSII
jgi:hypothetical protein